MSDYLITFFTRVPTNFHLILNLCRIHRRKIQITGINTIFHTSRQIEVNKRPGCSCRITFTIETDTAGIDNNILCLSWLGDLDFSTLCNTID